MATVQVSLCSSTSRLQKQPVLDTAIIAGDTISSSASSQQGTAVAGSKGGYDEYWCVCALGNVWVTFGTNPMATGNGATDFLVPSGTPAFFRARPGDKVAVMDAV